MQIIDTFLFSEPYEKEALLIKLNLSNKYIKEWILVENAYTFQGEYKGVFAQEMLDSDSRFDPFRHKIHVISSDIKYPPIDYSRSDIDTQGMNSERRQRSLAKKYILDKYPDDTWVLLSDADEAIDFESLEDNYDFLLSKMKHISDGLLCIPRRRFWYDFDNLWNAVRATPIVTVERLKQTDDDMGMGFLRSDHIGTIPEWSRTLIYEYSYCYDKQHILRKYRTFPHAGMTDEEIAQSIRCNHIPISKFRNKKLDLHPDLWMEKVELSAQNSPQFVRENIEDLRTHVIDSDYRTNRLKDYPHLYQTKHQVVYAIKQAIKKIWRLFI